MASNSFSPSRFGFAIDSVAAEDLQPFTFDESITPSPSNLSKLWEGRKRKKAPKKKARHEWELVNLILKRARFPFSTDRSPFGHYRDAWRIYRQKRKKEKKGRKKRKIMHNSTCLLYVILTFPCLPSASSATLNQTQVQGRIAEQLDRTSAFQACPEKKNTYIIY